MRDNMCFICLDPNHRRQACPYNVDARRDMQPREQRNFNRAPNPNGHNFCQGQNNNANQPRVVPQNNVGRNQPNQANQGRPQPRQNVQVPRNGGGPNVHPVPPGVRVNRVQANQDQEPVARVYAAVEHQGANQQFAVLQTPAEYEGTKFTLLIDSGSTHSFISPRCIRNLNLPEHPDVPLTVELATGKRMRTVTSVGSIDFKLGEAQTRGNFRVLNLGVYDGILGMDWLQENKATLKC